MNRLDVEEYNALEKLKEKIQIEKTATMKAFNSFHNAKPAPKGRAMAALYAAQVGVQADKMIRDINEAQKKL